MNQPPSDAPPVDQPTARNNSDPPSGLFNTLGGAVKPPDRLGDFRILREIGRGGMGVVYQAEQVSLGRHVAVKVLASPRVLDPKHVERFHREAKAAARLHHTNIVPVFGVGEQDGLHYYVMQYIDGKGLDAVLDELRRLQKERVGQDSDPADAADRIGILSHEEVSAEAVARSLLTGAFA